LAVGNGNHDVIIYWIPPEIFLLPTDETKPDGSVLRKASVELDVTFLKSAQVRLQDFARKKDQFSVYNQRKVLGEDLRTLRFVLVTKYSTSTENKEADLSRCSSHSLLQENGVTLVVSSASVTITC